MSSVHFNSLRVMQSQLLHRSFGDIANLADRHFLTRRAMFPLIFQRLCAHKFSLRNILPRLICIWNNVYEILCAKTFLEGTFYVHSKFPSSFRVRAHLTACVRAQTRTASREHC